MNELILVVDDDPKIVKLSRDYLKNSGFRILSATDGTTALAMANCVWFNLSAYVSLFSVM